MRCGVMILPEHRWSEAAGQWRAVERLGFDSAWTYDCLWWDPLADVPWLPAFPVLTAAACATTRLRLGTLVTSPNFRHPVVTAKEAMAIDDISRGRFTLGIGAGPAKAGDADVLDASLSRGERANRFTEFVELVDGLLREEITAHRGRFYSVADARMAPGCVQRPRVPIVVAATGPKGFALAARRADSWATLGPPNLSFAYSPEQMLELVGRQVAELERACVAIGRDPADIERIYVATDLTGDLMTSPEAFLDTAQRYAAAGISHLVVHWPRDHGLYAAAPDILDQIAEHALPKLRGL
jgi:alkanesulfonate monooxygenase SsuD/methylene tetrahydromethanopterin reductase-like flavin-dependent oxidoreductase (luciferase family)